MSEDRFLIIGLGSIGQRHLCNLIALGIENISAVRTRKRVLTEGIPIERVRIYNNIEDALENNPTAAIICNPTGLHISTALALASHGCHLMIEKPLSHSLEGIRDLEELASAKGLIMMVAYQMRFIQDCSWFVTL